MRRSASEYVPDRLVFSRGNRPTRVIPPPAFLHDILGSKGCVKWIKDQLLQLHPKAFLKSMSFFFAIFFLLIALPKFGVSSFDMFASGYHGLVTRVIMDQYLQIS